MDYQKDAKEFWDFDIGHHERIDLTTMIDFIKSKTGHEKLAYVGHSMGTTIMFRLAVSQPEYVRNNISTFIGIGPVIVPVNAANEAKVVEAVMPIQDKVYDTLTFFGMYSFGKPTPT